MRLFKKKEKKISKPVVNNIFLKSGDREIQS